MRTLGALALAILCGGCSDDGGSGTPSPYPYQPGEACWFSASLTPDAAVPYAAIRAGYWVDAVTINNVTYTSVFVELYGKDGSVRKYTPNALIEVAPDGTQTVTMLPGWEPAPYYNLRSGLEIVYGQEGDFDLRVKPYARLRFGAGGMTLDLDFPEPDGFTGTFSLTPVNTLDWTPSYYSCFDAMLVSGTFGAAGTPYTVTGDATLERWWEAGAQAAPLTTLTQTGKYWLYEPLYWRDAGGHRLCTLVWHFLLLWSDGSVTKHPLNRGVFSVDGVAQEIDDVDVDYNYPENSPGGVPGKYKVTGWLQGQKAFEYVMTVKGRDAEIHPWGSNVHHYATGLLLRQGTLYGGSGVTEWIATGYNPIP